MRQQQFLDVIDRDEAEQRFRQALDLSPLPPEEVRLDQLLGRVLAKDVIAPVDVPGFDRSNFDGFAVRANDTFGAEEESPISLKLISEPLGPGILPKGLEILKGTAIPIATGAVIPRGADAVVMVEHTEINDEHSKQVLIQRPAVPGAGVSFAGTDIGKGETVLWQGSVLSSRETGTLAALGIISASVIRRPKVAILSTGDEIIAPGATLQPGLVFDSNAVILADAVRELGAEPIPLGIVPDDMAQLRERLQEALEYDVVLISGGTSKGAGDVSYRVVSDLGKPGIVAHGVALKPGKPLCLAVIERQFRTIPVVILPGFPTSAIFTFREFVAPVIRRMAGHSQEMDTTLEARLPMRVNSERGRTEYLLVGLVQNFDNEKAEWTAYPMGKGSGSVTTFSRADGFITIPRQCEYLEAEETTTVHLLSRNLKPADLIIIGSHCIGLDTLLGQVQKQGFRTRLLAVGSAGGLAAAKRGECDIAGMHLFDEATEEWNRPYLTEELELIPGYGRLQGLVFRRGDSRFENHSVLDAIKGILDDSTCSMVNRNRGSGTRILIDRLLGSTQPRGYWTEARSHNAVVAAVAQGRADWGIAIEPVANSMDLGFLPLQEEQFDFVVPRQRLTNPAVQAFLNALNQREIRMMLQEKGFSLQ